MRVDGHLLVSFRTSEGLGRRRARGRRRAPVLGELLAPIEELSALPLDRGRVRFAPAREIAHVRLRCGELVRNALGVPASALRCREALFRVFTAALGIGTLRE